MKPKVSISFYIKGNYKDIYPYLIKKNALFKLVEKSRKLIILKLKKNFTDEWGLGDVDELYTQQKLYIDVQNKLGFLPKAFLGCYQCKLNPDSKKAFKDIIGFLKNKFPFFMVYTSEDINHDEIVYGYNPKTGAEIKNPKFSKRFSIS